jgi:hypothetical protein
MSINYPTSPEFQAVDFQINSPGLTTESFSGKLRRVSIGTQYFTFGVQYPNMTARNFGPVAAFISRQRGSFFEFDIVLPEISFSKGVNYAFINDPQTVSGAALPTGTTVIPLNNLGSNKQEIMRAGDLVRFLNHNKVYMLAENLNSNEAGEGTMTLTTGTLSPLPIGTKFLSTAVPIRAVLEDFQQEYSVSFGGITTMSLKMREVF